MGDQVPKTYEPAAMTLEGLGFDLKFGPGPYSSLPVPERFLARLGAILFLWTSIDQNASNMLSSLVRFYRSQDAIDKLYFRQRIGSLLRLGSKHFESTPKLQSEFTALMEQIRRCQKERNLLVHGQLAFNNLNGGALSAVDGRATHHHERLYDWDDIDSLYHDFAAAGGLLSAFGLGSIVPEMFPRELSCEERQVLARIPLLE